MITNSQIDFHDTFQPQMNYIAKVLELAAKNFCGTKQEISSETGIPTGKVRGKVVPHIKYAKYMGLISFTNIRGMYSLEVTELGKEVFCHDKYLLSTLTKWICHYGISNIVNGAPQWSFFMNRFDHNFEAIISYDFLKIKASDTFGFDVDFGVVKGSYYSGCFECLRLLEWNAKIKFIEHYYNPENLYFYAFTLLNNWELIFPNQNEISTIQIRDYLGWALPNGFQDAEMNNVLDELADAGFVIINRQLFPVTVIKTAMAKNIITKLYSNQF